MYYDIFYIILRQKIIDMNVVNDEYIFYYFK